MPADLIINIFKCTYIIYVNYVHIFQYKSYIARFGILIFNGNLFITYIESQQKAQIFLKNYQPQFLR